MREKIQDIKPDDSAREFNKAPDDHSQRAGDFFHSQSFHDGAPPSGALQRIMGPTADAGPADFFALQRAAGNRAVSGMLTSLQDRQSEGSEMPDSLKSRMEDSFNTSFDDVSLHEDSSGPGLIGAKAYTYGNHIHFAPGEFNPGAQSGGELLAHELSHVIQQRHGVHPTSMIAGIPLNDSASMEGQADTMGGEAASGGFSSFASFSSGADSAGADSAGAGSAVVQCEMEEEEEDPGLAKHIFDSDSEAGGIISGAIEGATTGFKEDVYGTTDKEGILSKEHDLSANIGGLVGDIHGAGSDILALKDSENGKLAKSSAAFGLLSKTAGGVGKSAGIAADKASGLSKAGKSDATHTSDIANSISGGLGTISGILDLADHITGMTENWNDMEPAEKIEAAAAVAEKLNAIGKGGVDTAKAISTAIDHYKGLSKDSDLTKRLDNAGAVFGSVTSSMASVKAGWEMGKGLEDFISEGGFDKMNRQEAFESVCQGLKTFTEWGQSGVDAAKSIATTVYKIGGKGAGAVKGLGTASGAVTIATGAMDVIQGGYGIAKAGMAKSKLTELGKEENTEEKKKADDTSLQMLGGDVSLSGMKNFKKDAQINQSARAGALEDLKSRQTDKQKEAGFQMAMGVVGIISGALAVSGVGAPVAVALGIGAALVKLGKWLYGWWKEKSANKREAIRTKAYDTLVGIEKKMEGYTQWKDENAWLDSIRFGDGKRKSGAKSIAENMVKGTKGESDKIFKEQENRETDKTKKQQIKKQKEKLYKDLDEIPKTVTWGQLSVEDKSEAVSEEAHATFSRTSLKVTDEEIAAAKKKRAEEKDEQDTATAREVLEDMEEYDGKMAEAIGFSVKKRDESARKFLDAHFSKQVADKKMDKSQKKQNLAEAKKIGYWDSLTEKYRAFNLTGSARIEVIKTFINK
ncbi:hypothetical protein EPICR_110016 [Candidatus Desulfarcum epimagneticum]|uniref:eCIS core domain-containing protein n=1 Tax=uncultured Desulfobacteraceae bacterium TaxID=218296 RepID=A0A484HJL7_9BACT|nr:hypothetical protein EPICR_110016 [uncultured Desulfobacteraceae bacterium]